MIVTFDLVPKDVLDVLPSNQRGVTDTSEGLNTTKIEKWILEGAAQVCALMERVKVDLVTASNPAEQSYYIARTAIIAYAAAKCLELGTNANDPRIERAWKQWDDAKDDLSEYPNRIGKVVGPRVKSNVPLGERHLTFRNRRW